MTRKEWKAVAKAGTILGIGEQATQGAIKRAYYRCSKQHHPDTADKNHGAEDGWMNRFGQDPLWSKP